MLSSCESTAIKSQVHPASHEMVHLNHQVPYLCDMHIDASHHALVPFMQDFPAHLDKLIPALPLTACC
jgi:hypothetical protein